MNRVTILVSLENGYLASSSYDTTIKIWEINQGKLKFTFNSSNGGHSDYVNSLVALEDWYLASAADDWTVKVWDITQGKIKFTFNSSNGGHNNLI